jgi:alkylation response protein AidB-like acyl-CoA dehydrogenase
MPPAGAASSVDREALAALAENLATVLDAEADSLALHAFVDGRSDLDRRLWAMAGELGWLAVGLPEAYGGLGLGAHGLGLLFAQLGRRLAPGAFTPTLAAAQALLETADDGVKAEWLPRIAAGELSLAVPAVVLGAMEQDAGWWLGAPDARLALAPTHDGIWALVELDGAAAPATMWDATRNLFRQDLSGGSTIARLPDAAAVEASLARHLALAVAADATGAARAILDHTIGYMKERRQFDRPIASFQALKHRAADLMTLVVSGEEVLGLALDAVADGEPCADAWVLLAKARQTEAYTQVASECLQLHGGVGFTSEFDVHLHLKRARLNEMLAVPNRRARDLAAARLAAEIGAGASVLEMA